MYLFTRSARLAPGHFRDGMEWAVTMCDKVNQITALNIGLWTTAFSPGVGALSWGTFVESLADLEEANGKLSVDAMYLDAIDRGGALLTGGADDETAQVVHGNVDPSMNPTHVAAVRSQLANGNFQRGMEVGVEIAERATKLGGLETMFVMASTGTYAGCGWLTGASSLRELEAAENATNTNPDFIKYIDKEAAACFLPGVTTTTIWRHIH